MESGATADWVGTLVPKMAHPAENPSGYSHYRLQGFQAYHAGVISRAREKSRKSTEMADGRAQWTGRTKAKHAIRSELHADAMESFISESVVGIPTV